MLTWLLTRAPKPHTVVITQDDLVTALKMIHEGYRVASEFEYVEPWKWATAVVLLFSVGILGVSVSFLLIITSRDGESTVYFHSFRFSLLETLDGPLVLLLLTLCFLYPERLVLWQSLILFSTSRPLSLCPC